MIVAVPMVLRRIEVLADRAAVDRPVRLRRAVEVTADGGLDSTIAAAQK
jgi:hypothetical protein